MARKSIVIVLFVISHVFISCTSMQRNNQETAILPDASPHIDYAQGFSISSFGDVRVLRFFNQGDTTNCDSVVLYPEGKKIGFGFTCKSVKIPVKSVACLSATHLSFLDKLGMIDKVTGVTSLEHSDFPSLAASVRSGKIKEIAIGGKFKTESLIALNPDVVLYSPMKGQSLTQLEKSGLILIPIGEYLETSPLGRAEWIKYISTFFQKENLANDIFDSLEMKYLHLRSLTSKIEMNKRPTVFSGNLISGVWYMPGGNSYESAFFKDAGANYLWKDDHNPGSISLDFESVYACANQADFWRIVVFTEKQFSYNYLLIEDERYINFKAFNQQQIFYCNTRKSPLYQIGVLQPHIILADYIHVFHPDLLPDYQPVYYQLLK